MRERCKTGDSPVFCRHCSKPTSAAAAKSGKHYQIKVITDYSVKLVCLGSKNNTENSVKFAAIIAANRITRQRQKAGEPTPPPPPQTRVRVQRFSRYFYSYNWFHYCFYLSLKLRRLNCYVCVGPATSGYIRSPCNTYDIPLIKI